ncbi:MAG: hypothetical protein K6F70_00750 [Eggerthellaceae bacterium]|nr:hypothetical protein [Eggerthellaceae bacterium]
MRMQAVRNGSARFAAAVVVAVCAMAVSLVVGVAPTPAVAAEVTSTTTPNWTLTQGTGGKTAAGLTEVAKRGNAVADALVQADGSMVLVGGIDGKSATVAPEGVELGSNVGAWLAFASASGAITSQTAVTGNADDYFSGVAALHSGDGYVAVGVTRSSEVNGVANHSTKAKTSDQDALLCVFDTSGVVQKTLLYGGGNDETSTADGFDDIIATSDGGYLAVGYTQSTDGDLSGLKESNSHRNLLAVKFDANFNVLWTRVIGGDSGDGGYTYEEFTKVVETTDGYVCVGYIGSVDGDFEGLNAGSADAVAAKFSADGTQQWLHTYGGTARDELFDVVSDGNGGFVAVGYTASTDGAFASAGGSGTNSALVLHLNAQGTQTSATTLAAGEGKSEAYGIVAIEDGYLVAGKANTAAGAFADATLAGQFDGFIASLDAACAVQKVTTYGGDADDSPYGLTTNAAGDVAYLYGYEKSSSFYGNACASTASKSGDAFVLAQDVDSLLPAEQAQGYTLSVSALHATADQTSMMAPLLYDTAYAEQNPTDGTYTVTVYFTNATIMSSSVYAESLGAATYNQNGDGVTMIAADSDVYDEATQVKRVTMTLSPDVISQPVLFGIEGMMGGGKIRLSFDMNSLTAVDENPIEFDEVEIDAPAFDSAWKTVFGGSGTESANGMDVLEGGVIVTVGDTASSDHDFSVRSGSASSRSGFVKTFDDEGGALATKLIDGAKYVCATSVSAQDDGDYFFVSGYAQNEDGVATTGDLASVDPEAYGGRNGFVQKYASDGTLVWTSGVNSNGSMQLNTVRATSDGGCIVLGTAMLATSGQTLEGDYADELVGLGNTLVVKYDAQGSEQWHKTIAQAGALIATYGVDELSDGSFALAGQTTVASCGSGAIFDGAAFSGGTFDAYVAVLSSSGELQWAKTFGSSANDAASDLLATEDGGFAFVGYTECATDDGGSIFAGKTGGEQTAFVIKCNASGDADWIDALYTLDGDTSAACIAQAENGYAVVGTTSASTGVFANLDKGNDDAFLAIYTPEGVRSGLSVFGGSQTDTATSIAKIPGSDNFALLLDSSSSDGDMANLSIGSSDAVLLALADPTVSEKPEPIASVSMFRMYNPNGGEHFYTASVEERDWLSTLGWKYEGIGWTAPATSDAPVYRLYNPNGGDHHYTMSAEERDWLRGLGWKYEGIGWYSDDNQTTVLYRAYNPNAVSGSHHYTTSLDEKNHLVSLGWHDEGTAWYGL